MASSNNGILQGSLSAIILKLLRDGSRMYGYEMTRAVREGTSGRITLTEAALYLALHRLVAEGLLETESETVNGRVRKYYRIARKQEAETAERITSLTENLTALQKLLYEPRIQTG